MGTFWSAKLIAKHLVDTKTPGSIVMIASVSGQGIHTPVQAVTIYNASKGTIIEINRTSTPLDETGHEV